MFKHVHQKNILEMRAFSPKQGKNYVTIRIDLLVQEQLPKCAWQFSDELSCPRVNVNVNRTIQRTLPKDSPAMNVFAQAKIGRLVSSFISN